MAKTKRTVEAHDTILECAALGMSDKDCYTIACIGKSTFYDWLKDDTDFSDDIARERINGKRLLIERVIKSAAGDARHAEWLLSHRWPDDFSEKRIIEERTPPDSPLERFITNNAGDEEEPSDGS